MTSLSPRLMAALDLLVGEWRNRTARSGHRLARDVALWLRAPAGQRPTWSDR